MIANSGTLAQSAVDTNAIADDAVTGIKQSYDNVELLQYSPSGNNDFASATLGTWITFSNATIPTWATSVIVSAVITGTYAVSAANTMELRIKIGSDTGRRFRIYNINLGTSQIITHSYIDKLTLTATGSQTVYIEAIRLAGSNGIRADVDSEFSIKLDYIK